VPELTSGIHHAYSFNVNEAIFMVSDQQLFKFDVPTNTVTALHHLYILNLRFVDASCFYAIVAKDGQEHGLYLFDAHDVEKKGLEAGIFLCKVNVGNFGMDFNFRNERLAVVPNYHQMKIFPLMHRSTLSILGMPASERILAFREQGDELTVLTTFNQLITFSKTTA